jgi:hypothetical protein
MKHHLIRHLWLLAFSMIFIGNTVPGLAQTGGDLTMRDWSTDSVQSLEKHPPTASDVEKLVNQTTGQSLDSDQTMALCSYKFVDFAKDGIFRLIASLDVNGRHFCNNVVVIGKSGEHFDLLNNWNVWKMDDVNAALYDLNNDQHRELILSDDWSNYEGTKCVATWQKVYQWRNGKLTDNSATFPKFYKARLKTLRTQIPHESDPTCDEMESDKILRYLGFSSKSGFARAMTWMKDPDESLRRKAVAVFADINDDASRKALAILKNDADPSVAAYAKFHQGLPIPSKE